MSSNLDAYKPHNLNTTSLIHESVKLLNFKAVEEMQNL